VQQLMESRRVVGGERNHMRRVEQADQYCWTAHQHRCGARL